MATGSAALLALLVSPAAAEIEGNCTATINGVDLRGVSATDAARAVVVQEHTQVAVSMQSPTPLTELRVHLELAGLRWTVLSRAISGTAWQEAVPVDQYARYGVGLYRVIGESRGREQSCAGAALVRVQGDPLQTVAGLGGAAAAALGVLGVAGTSLAAALGSRAAGRRPVRLSGWGLISGLLAGAGSVLLLQQYGLLFPTGNAALAGVGAGVAIGGLVLPSLAGLLRH